MAHFVKADQLPEMSSTLLDLVPSVVYDMSYRRGTDLRPTRQESLSSSQHSSVVELLPHKYN